MSDAISHLNALFKSAREKQQQQQGQGQGPPQMQQLPVAQSQTMFPQQLQHLQMQNKYPPMGDANRAGAPLPMNLLPKAITEQELQQLLFAGQSAPGESSQPSSSSSSLPLLSQIPLPNRDQMDNIDRADLLDEFEKLSLLNATNQPVNNPPNLLNNSNPNRANNNNNNSSNNNSQSRVQHIKKLSTSNSINTSLNDSSSDIIYSSDRYYMPGTASLIEDVDKQLMVILRDGKTLIGYLRSIDQFANLLLSQTIERIHVGNKYGDIPRGVYIVRGENVVLIGEVDFELPVKVDMVKVSVNEILELQRQEQLKQQEVEKNKKKSLMNRCLLPQADSILDDYY